jgi:hypothetical protein
MDFNWAPLCTLISLLTVVLNSDLRETQLTPDHPQGKKAYCLTLSVSVIDYFFADGRKALRTI